MADSTLKLSTRFSFEPLTEVTSTAGTDYLLVNQGGNNNKITLGNFETNYVNPIIDGRVNKAFVDALNVDADTLDGIDSTGFSLTGHTHGALDVTSGTFADARISATSVQQHVTKTYVDGLNVDADTLDSLDSTQFLRSDTLTTLDTTGHALRWKASAATGGNEMWTQWAATGDTDAWMIVPAPIGAASYGNELRYDFTTSRWRLRGATQFDSTPTVGADTIWHNGNFPFDSTDTPSSGEVLTWNSSKNQWDSQPGGHLTQGVKLIGSGTGDANLSFLPFYENNGTTRRGYVGDAQSGNDDIYLAADTGTLNLRTNGVDRLTILIGGATHVWGDLNVSGNIQKGSNLITGTSIDAHNYVYGQYGTIARSTDEWLRINDGTSHTNGIYCSSSILRTDGELQVGSGGSNFRVTSAGTVTMNKLIIPQV